MNKHKYITLLAGLMLVRGENTSAFEVEKFPEIPENMEIVGQADAIAFPINHGKLGLESVWSTAQQTRPKEYDDVTEDQLSDRVSVGDVADHENSIKADQGIKIGFNYHRHVSEVVKVIRDDGGHGSGFYFQYGEANYIITNYHVVEGYSEVGIQFHPDAYKNLTNKPLPVHFGRVLIFDEVKDLAAIRLNDQLPANLKPRGAQISTFFEETAKIGNEVHAIGHPFGEDWTYTRGYISQLRKQYGWNSGAVKHHVADVIQTQTPINVGNSGGPLYDILGQVIGVTTFGKADPGAQGMNFAVDVREVISFLSKFETRKSPEITKELALNLIGTKDENKNGISDLYFWDDNQNSIVDAWGFDEDEDNYIEEIYFDRNENKKVELFGYLFHDKNGLITSKGNWVFVYEHDDNEDGEKDRVSIDTDLDGRIDLTM